MTFVGVEIRKELIVKLLIVLVTGLNCSWAYVQRQHGLETNEVVQDNEWDVQLKDPHAHLRECQAHSVCSFVQANARGTSSRHYCRCAPSSASRCSSVWDPLDGHSITQGSDQYKFCERAPVVLPCVDTNSVAYTSTLVYAKESGDLLTTVEHVHCKCLELHTYETADTTVTDLNDRVEVMEVKYACVPLKTCRVSEACKAVTESVDNYFVNPKCLCPDNLSCPTVTEYALETFSMGRGTVRLLGCQNK